MTDPFGARRGYLHSRCATTASETPCRFPPRNAGVRLARRCPSPTARLLGDDGEHRLPVGRALLLADTGDALQLPLGRRPVLGERAEGGIAKDDVRGHPLLASRLGAPLAQALEQRPIVLVQTVRGAGFRGLGLRAAPHRVAPQGHRRLAAQHGSSRLRGGERTVLTLRDEDAAGEELADDTAPILI